MRRIALIMLAIGLAVVAVPAVAGVPAESAGSSSEQTPEDGIVRVDPWTLLQSDGAELYQQMCASCHGNEGVGGRTVFMSPTAINPPPLTHLEAQGIPRDHWVYIIESPCDDAVHTGPHGTESMPCWQRIFRLALGNDAAPLLVSTKLASYLDTIQVDDR
jgi:hypothetical protein